MTSDLLHGKLVKVVFQFYSFLMAQKALILSYFMLCLTVQYKYISVILMFVFYYEYLLVFTLA